MSGFQLLQAINRNKVFLLNKNQLEDVWNAEFYKPVFLENREKLKRNKYGLVKLQSITSKITKGETPLWRGDDYFKQGVMFVKSENVLENELNVNDTDFIAEEVHSRMKRSQLKKGDVLLNIVGASIGRACVYDKDHDANINQAVCLIRLNDGFNPFWLSSLLNSTPYKTWINQLKSGGARDNIDLGQANVFLIPNHPKDVQESIISINQKAAEKKKKNEAAAEKLLASIDDYLLEELRITLPTAPENILKNRIYKTSIKEISGGRFDPAFHQLYFHQLVEAIENSKYSKTKLGDHLSEISYGASFNNFYVDTGVPLLRIKDLKRNEISVDEVVYLPESARTQLGNCFVKTNDFLISRSGTIGVVAIVPKGIDGFAFGSFMIKFNLKDTAQVNREYLSYFLNCGLLAKLIERNKIGAIQGNITIPIIKSLPIVLPTIDKQIEIAEHITDIRKQAQQLKDKTKEELKKASNEIEKILLH